MEENNIVMDNQAPAKPKKKKKLATVRAALVCLLVFTLICGVIYPVGVTIVANALFPYEANGSVIEVTLKDGTKKVYGSELIGQSFENPKYLFGRVNLGSPSNLSPESEEFKALVSERIAERKTRLAEVGYTDTKDIPDELLTSSGSGLDPHITVNAAYFQIPAIVKARQSAGEDITEAEVKTIIDNYTEGRFLGIFGTKRVNVLLVNLALDGKI